MSGNMESNNFLIYKDPGGHDMSNDVTVIPID